VWSKAGRVKGLAKQEALNLGAAFLAQAFQLLRRLYPFTRRRHPQGSSQSGNRRDDRQRIVAAAQFADEALVDF
jgi:hypothetical protein